MTKAWKCNNCGKTDRTTDRVIIKLCPACLEEMREVKECRK